MKGALRVELLVAVLSSVVACGDAHPVEPDEGIDCISADAARAECTATEDAVCEGSVRTFSQAEVDACTARLTGCRVVESLLLCGAGTLSCHEPCD
jgi:hypothetical protein